MNASRKLNTSTSIPVVFPSYDTRGAHLCDLESCGSGFCRRGGRRCATGRAKDKLTEGQSWSHSVCEAHRAEAAAGLLSLAALMPTRQMHARRPRTRLPCRSGSTEPLASAACT
eukprot:4011884-Pleurochrysis_carterae.AAC.2